MPLQMKEVDNGYSIGAHVDAWVNENTVKKTGNKEKTETDPGGSGLTKLQPATPPASLTSVDETTSASYGTGSANAEAETFAYMNFCGTSNSWPFQSGETEVKHKFDLDSAVTGTTPPYIDAHAYGAAAGYFEREYEISDPNYDNGQWCLIKVTFKLVCTIGSNQTIPDANWDYGADLIGVADDNIVQAEWLETTNRWRLTRRLRVDTGWWEDDTHYSSVGSAITEYVNGRNLNKTYTGYVLLPHNDDRFETFIKLHDKPVGSWKGGPQSMKAATGSAGTTGMIQDFDCTMDAYINCKVSNAANGQPPSSKTGNWIT